jgi:CIC family chloride channel protein
LIIACGGQWLFRKFDDKDRKRRQGSCFCFKLVVMNENESGLAPSDREPAHSLNRVRLAWSEYRLLCYAALLGVAGGLGAQLFVWILNFAERLLLVGIAGYQPPEPGSLNPEPVIGHWGLWLIPLSTTLGGLLSGILVYTFAPEAEGHGTDAAVEAFHFKGGKVRPIVPLIKTFASAITIGSGGAAGREGPTAQISVGVGSMLADLLRLPDEDRRVLVLAGMAAGLAAIFRSPLGMAICC